MTENNAAQPGLTDAEILHRWDIYVSEPCASYPLTDSGKIDFARAIESALLSKLRAEGVQAGDEDTPPIAPDDEAVADAWITASDCDGIAYDGPSFERGYRAALASAPVAGVADNTDYIGMALELESAAKRVESQTVQRAIEAAAHGLRLAHSFRNAAPQASEAKDDDQAFSAALCRANSAESMWHKFRDELRAVKANVEKLRSALILARDARGVMLMTDPPQEAWKVRHVDDAIRDALSPTQPSEDGGGHEC